MSNLVTDGSTFLPTALGDDIIEDIKKIIGLIEKGNENQPGKISEEEKLDELGIRYSHSNW